MLREPRPVRARLSCLVCLSTMLANGYANSKAVLAKMKRPPLKDGLSDASPYHLIADAPTYRDTLTVAPHMADDHAALAAVAIRLAVTPTPRVPIIAAIVGADVNPAGTDADVYLRARYAGTSHASGANDCQGK
jgi:hypothetical protein